MLDIMQFLDPIEPLDNRLRYSLHSTAGRCRFPIVNPAGRQGLLLVSRLHGMHGGTRRWQWRTVNPGPMVFTHFVPVLSSHSVLPCHQLQAYIGKWNVFDLNGILL